MGSHKTNVKHQIDVDFKIMNYLFIPFLSIIMVEMGNFFENKIDLMVSDRESL